MEVVNKYVQELRVAENELLARKADIEAQLQEQLRYVGGRSTREVEVWLRKVGEAINEAQRVADEVSKGKSLSCLNVGKHVEQITRDMKKLCAQGGSFWSLVVHDAPSTDSTDIASHSRARDEIYNYLIGQEAEMIGVWGVGGIGKTTIVRHVYNKLLKENYSSKMIWITVSQSSDIHKLQNDIADALGTDLLDDESTNVRAAKLKEALETGSYLLILDDVGPNFSLEEVGIPEPSANKGCKLVLTTRERKVVQKKGYKEVQVGLLSDDEAFQLFLSKVGEDVLLADPTIRKIMKGMVKECGGLPLEIVTVAIAMKGVHDPHRWNDALIKLKRRGDVLKSSYDNLLKPEQDCFVHCVLYPKDYGIPKEDIIEYWIEEGLVVKMKSREEMKSKGHAYLQRILDSSLLLGTNGKNIVMMHDIVRDMALSLSLIEKRFLVKAGMKLNELPDELEKALDIKKISLMDNFISKIPPEMSPKIENLTTLLLSGNS